ncbi:DUF551 domain-containing protein [Escherichia sp. E3659]|uniref:DUF551 domain-containing protein n=1 Tax=Escherichia sp. E3659 TaxID=2044462 RepID=UPI001080A559|nr:hypothetical protein CRI65_01740 [Escherichia sp. E3659]TLJ12712.1 DUF551 domain-containing protein [Escherichia sp. E3659]
MTELTKEQLIEEAKLKIAVAKCYPNSEMARVECELFKIALTSLEADPVAWKATFTQIDNEYNTFTDMYSDKAEAEQWVQLHKLGDFRSEITPLYAAPPATVVPDERAAYELFMEKRFGDSVDRRRAKNGGSEYMAWDMAIGWIIWCHRAAMFQAGNFRENNNSSTSSPATPDGWISCSDAVPAEYCDVILCDDLGNVFPGSWDKVFCPTRGGNKMAFVDEDGVEVESSTHWMPLPEPPQEVN